MSEARLRDFMLQRINPTIKRIPAWCYYPPARLYIHMDTFSIFPTFCGAHYA